MKSIRLMYYLTWYCVFACDKAKLLDMLSSQLFYLQVYAIQLTSPRPVPVILQVSLISHLAATAYEMKLAITFK